MNFAGGTLVDSGLIGGPIFAGPSAGASLAVDAGAVAIGSGLITAGNALAAKGTCDLVNAVNSSWNSGGNSNLPTGDKITGYTQHGAEQALRRDGGIGVSNDAIMDAVNNPTQVVQQASGTTKYVGQDATVVLNQNGQVVTTWANSSAGVR